MIGIDWEVRFIEQVFKRKNTDFAKRQTSDSSRVHAKRCIRIFRGAASALNEHPWFFPVTPKKY